MSRLENRVRKEKRRFSHDAASPFSISRAAQPERGIPYPRRRRGARNAPGRWYRPAPQYEAEAASSCYAGRPSAREGAARDAGSKRKRTRPWALFDHNRDCTKLADQGAIHGTVAGGVSNRHSAHPQPGDSGRQSLSRYSLQLLQPELRMEEGDQFLHKKGGRHVLGGNGEPPLRRRLVDRYRAGAHGARSSTAPGFAARRA